MENWLTTIHLHLWPSTLSIYGELFVKSRQF